MQYDWIDISALEDTRKRALLKYLESYLSERRSQLFDRILNHRTRHFSIAAEDTYQEHNASALIRTCDCFGIQDMHVVEEYNEFRIAKGMAKGAEKWVDVHFYEAEDNMQECIDHLRAMNYSIVATSSHKNDCLLEDFDVERPSVFFFGQEKNGLTDQVLDQADAFLKVPMVGFTESFNISVSAAIILNVVSSKLRESSSIAWQLSEQEKIDKKIEWSLKTICNAEPIFNDFLKERR